MSPAFNGSSVLQHFECSNAVALCNRIMFDFYLGLPHVCCFSQRSNRWFLLVLLYHGHCPPLLLFVALLQIMVRVQMSLCPRSIPSMLKGISAMMLRKSENNSTSGASGLVQSTCVSMLQLEGCGACSPRKFLEFTDLRFLLRSFLD